MSYVVKITQNGELAIGGGQYVVTKEALESALNDFNARLAHQNVLGHLHRRDCGELLPMGFSHKVTATFNSNGESFAVIEPIQTPDGAELERLLKDCKEFAENNERYEFAAKGYIVHGDFNLTGLDVIRKGNILNM